MDSSRGAERRERQAAVNCNRRLGENLAAAEVFVAHMLGFSLARCSSFSSKVSFISHSLSLFMKQSVGVCGEAGEGEVRGSGNLFSAGSGKQIV